MLPKAAFFILFPVLLFSASTGLECNYLVSSSDGINNTSCWTGGYQTPCATLDLALQGTTTVQDKCSSGTVINLSPGNYTLDTTTLLEQQLLRNNVSIIGMRNGNEYAYGEAKITCLNVSSSSYHWLRYIVFQCVSLYNCNNVPVSCTWPSFGFTTAHNALSQELCPVLNLNFKFINLPLQCWPGYCECGPLQFTVSITDTCSSKVYNWKNNLHVCKNSSCQNAKIISPCNYGADDDPYNVYYELDQICFNSSNVPIEFSFFIQTLDVINVSTDTVTSVTTECVTNASTIDGQCYHDNYTEYVTPSCHTAELAYLLPVDDYYHIYGWDYDTYNDDNKCPYCIDECCYYKTTDQCYANCTSESGIPINDLTCIQCKNYGLLMFFGIEILPITIIVLLILVFNIKLTNGFNNGVVFYSQMVAVAYSSYNFLSKWDANNIAKTLTIKPLSIFNLDFSPFLSHSLCITPYMSPLGAISFWYIVGLYPLIFLLLFYVWIVLYDKGFRCVVFITRPFHHCMARFWNTTGIEPSFAHSTASVYILCFTQLAATSFKVLSYDKDFFYYDAKIRYFHGVHGLAGFFATLVLLILIILPTLYIQFYPLKWFRKLLDHLHLKKPLLTSLGNAFTGPYKNGSNNTFDYRYFAGLHLLARIIILFQYIHGMQYYAYAMPVTQACCCFLLAVMVLMFRPFQRNIHTFFELILEILLGVIGVTILATNKISIVVSIINCFILGILIPGYVIYQIIKMAKACFHYHIRIPVTQPSAPNDEDWIADRMENPREYDEQHVTVGVDDHPEEQQPITNIATAATYGSTTATTN